MSATAEQLFEDESVRDRFLAHYEDLRGQVRTQVVRRHLCRVLLDATSKSLRVLDVGCGDGRDAIWVASRGHDVIGVDPAEAMIQRAHERSAEASVRGSIEFRRGDAGLALREYGDAYFDLVLSHGVLMYQDEPNAFIKQHVELLRPNGMLSLVAKNAEALARRAVQEASIDEAITLLDDTQSIGHLGILTGAQTIQQLADIGFAAGTTVRSWAGVRMFSDSPTESMLEADHEKLLELEWRAACRDPHRRTAALLHVLLLRGVDLSLLPV